MTLDGFSSFLESGTIGIYASHSPNSRCDAAKCALYLELSQTV